MRAETKKALEDSDKCIREFDSLICDIRKFNGTDAEKEKEREMKIPNQVAVQIDQIGWVRSAAMTLLGALHINQ